MSNFKHGEMIFSISHPNGEKSYIIWNGENDTYETEGYIGYGHEFNNIKDLLLYLTGFDFHISNLFF